MTVPALLGALTIASVISVDSKSNVVSAGIQHPLASGLV
jgi:hypothetical protein